MYKNLLMNILFDWATQFEFIDRYVKERLDFIQKIW